MVVRLTLMFVTGLICNVVVVLIAGRATGTLTTTITPSSLLSSQGAVMGVRIHGGGVQRRGREFFVRAGAVGPGEQSVAGELFQTMTQVGTSFGVTASTIVFNHVQQGADRNGADALASYHAAMWTGVAFGGLDCGRCARRKRRTRGSGVGSNKEEGEDVEGEDEVLE
ncbi:hypothetical protein C8R44DRAFT_787486 [Mycena epipterygia]|nr:hypothetical protein C8R44DRAFT_787486 [Mycena epipterygia]